MKARTKRQLNAIFALGLITSALSIGRASTLTKETLSEDTTCTLYAPFSHLERLMTRQGDRYPVFISPLSKANLESYSHAALPSVNSGPTGRETVHAYQLLIDSFRMKTSRRCATVSTCVTYFGIARPLWWAIGSSKQLQCTRSGQRRQIGQTTIRRAQERLLSPHWIYGKIKSKPSLVKYAVARYSMCMQARLTIANTCQVQATIS